MKWHVFIKETFCFSDIASVIKVSLASAGIFKWRGLISKRNVYFSLNVTFYANGFPTRLKGALGRGGGSGITKGFENFLPWVGNLASMCCARYLHWIDGEGGEGSGCSIHDVKPTPKPSILACSSRSVGINKILKRWVMSLYLLYISDLLCYNYCTLCNIRW